MCRLMLLQLRTALLLGLVLLYSHGSVDAAEDVRLPRFASLRADEVNLRAGPGKEYPVEWVFRRAALPVEIVAEYDQWRKIRDIDGTEGWVHRSLLSGARTVTVTGGIRELRQGPGEAEPLVARAEPGVLASLIACEAGWCRIEARGYTGWLPAAHLWGLYPYERGE